MPLTVQQHQGLHGEGFVFAMASAAGLLAMRPILDVDGIDWLIGYPGTLGAVRSPKIEVQVKTWSAPTGDDDCWRYRMRAAQYNALAGEDFDLRRYLVLVTVPRSPDGFAICDADRMELGHAAYWVSLADRTPVTGTDEAATVEVRVPRANLLTPATLMTLVRGERAEVTT